MCNNQKKTKKRLKVLHLISNKVIGGIENMLSNLVPRVDNDRCEMCVVNMRSKSPVYELWDKCRVKYYRLKTPSMFPLDSVLELVKLLRREKIDVLEIYGLRANVIGRLAAKISGVPVVITGVLSTDDWRKWYHVWLDRLTAWAVTGWVPNSKACMQSLVEREKYPPERFNVIYDGIDTKAWTRTGDDNIRQSIRKSLNCDHEDIVCTTVGNFRRPKGYSYLIEAIHEMLDVNPKLHFVFVGKGPMEEELKLKCKKLKLEEKVTFTGYRSDIKGIYEASDIALLPSLHEGLPICLIEAMSMELPVVATKVSGIPELVEDGVTGFLVPPRNTKALSEAIIKLIADHRLRVQMGQAGRQRVCKMFTIEQMIEELLAYYQQQFKSVVCQKS